VLREQGGKILPVPEKQRQLRAKLDISPILNCYRCIQSAALIGDSN